MIKRMKREKLRKRLYRLLIVLGIIVLIILGISLLIFKMTDKEELPQGDFIANEKDISNMLCI